jgi:hypothetical protein
MRIKSAVLAIVALAWLLTAGEAGARGPGGSIIDSQGQRTQVQEFLDLLPAFYFSLNDSEQSAPLKDIKSLTWLGGGQIRLENRRGESFTVIGAMQISKGEMIRFRALDPVSGQINQAEMDPLLVKKISFAWPK